MLSGELESLRSELDILNELSGQLVSLSGGHETGQLDQVISDLTTDYQQTCDECTAHAQHVDSALQQTNVFNDQLVVCNPSCTVLLCQLLCIGAAACKFL